MREDSSYLLSTHALSVLREDLLLVTGNVKQALLLNQFYYLTQRDHDLKKIFEEELSGIENKKYGWIQKSSSSIINETKIFKCRKWVGVNLSCLQEKGLIFARKPMNSFNKQIKQYRLHLSGIHSKISDARLFR